MSECVVRMEMPENCFTCDARCVSALYGYICGIERKDVMPFLGKKNRPDWCPIICQLPERHGRLIDADEFLKRAIGTKCFDEDDSRMLTELVGESIIIVPADTAERSEA